MSEDILSKRWAAVVVSPEYQDWMLKTISEKRGKILDYAETHRRFPLGQAKDFLAIADEHNWCNYSKEMRMLLDVYGEDKEIPR